MGYYLEAVIGKKSEIIKKFESNEKLIVELNYDFSMIPLVEQLTNEIELFEGTNYDEKLLQWLKIKSKKSLIAYISAEYFGGMGVQSIKIFENEDIIEDIKNQDNAINHTLEYFGLKKDKNKDQFELVGLSKHRKTEDWIN
ncbi:MAG TPA: hypothetical protein PK419_00295 [Spirochaetota bacterium]|jgi:hypothetical protein|nr:hypothetical protein [Spirochaetota bacterium]HOH36972.1 hypothetical protein [Spirochaetota bacterium]HPJ14241.1 hypothetical protein [Spirochaetota bacterium]HPY03014.1 hypothetical protein [Spirochaetota bacterium]HQA51272.1 hypothetical protein [Spirochaetota bacterium]